MDSSSPSTAPPEGRGTTVRWWLAALALASTVALLIVTTASAADPRLPHGPLPRTAATPAAVRARANGAKHATGAARAANANRAGATTTTTTTLPAPAVVAPPPPEDTTLLTPEDVPDPSVRRPIQLVGRIQIPKIGLDTDLRDQITQESIDLGPSHWPGTAAPGGFGNVVIAGHRSSHSAPFHDLGVLAVGDAIILRDTSGRAFTYHVTEQFVVYPSAMWITDQKPGHTLTLFTCHPIGSASQRLVIRATLV